jgi:hypothetical protein
MIFDDRGKWLFSRLIAIFVRGHVANAFESMEFSQFSGG